MFNDVEVKKPVSVKWKMCAEIILFRNVMVESNAAICYYKNPKKNTLTQWRELNTW